MQCGCRLSYCPKVCADTKKISANANRTPVLGGKGTNKIRITQTFTVKKFYTPNESPPASLSTRLLGGCLILTCVNVVTL